MEEELDPLAEQFREEVRMARLPLANLDLDNPVLRGETFDAMRSIDVGLIDGIQTLNEALMEAQTLGRKWEDERRQLRNKVFSLI